MKNVFKRILWGLIFVLLAFLIITNGFEATIFNLSVLHINIITSLLIISVIFILTKLIERPKRE